MARGAMMQGVPRKVVDEQARQHDGILTLSGRRVTLEQLRERALRREKAMGFRAVEDPRANPELAREMLRRAQSNRPLGRYL